MLVLILSAGVAGVEKPRLTPLSMTCTSTPETLGFSFCTEVSAIIMLSFLQTVVEHCKTTMNSN